MSCWMREAFAFMAALSVMGMTNSAITFCPYKAIGCYADSDVGERDFAVFGASSDSMNLQLCADVCANAGYRYAGVQDGAQCFCDNSYGRYGTSQDCIKQCSTTSDICGGGWANSVLDIGLLQPPPLSDQRFVLRRSINKYLPESVLEILNNVHCIHNLCLVLCLKHLNCNAFNFRVNSPTGCRCELQVIVSAYYPNDSYITEDGSSHWETDLMVAGLSFCDIRSLA